VNKWILLAILAAIISPMAGIFAVCVMVFCCAVDVICRLYERLAYKIYLRGNKNA
jgi:hypothetical protein